MFQASCYLYTERIETSELDGVTYLVTPKTAICADYQCVIFI